MSEEKLTEAQQADAARDHETPEQKAEREYCSPIAGFGEQPTDGGKIHYGGQAVIEGVMMRGPEKVATAVRLPSGEIAIHAEEFIPATRKHRLLRLPIVRGGVTLIESLTLGIKALNYSAGVAIEEVASSEEEEALAADAAEAKVQGAGEARESTTLSSMSIQRRPSLVRSRRQSRGPSHRPRARPTGRPRPR